MEGETGNGSWHGFCNFHGGITPLAKIRYSMKQITLLLGAVALLVLNGCGSSMRIYADRDPEAQFDQYRTYSFLDFTEGNKKTIPGMELERIRVAMARELESRGLALLEKDGDVSVQITVYHRQGMDRYYWYYNRRVYMERAVTVDMYDNRNQRHVWHCAAVDELVYDPEKRAGELSQVAATIFSKYPVPAPAAP